MAGGGRARIKAARAAGEERLAWAQENVPAVDAGMNWFEREQASGAALLAGGLAYRFFFWLVSFGLVLAAVGSIWADQSGDDLEKTAKSVGLGGVAAHSARTALEKGTHSSWYFLIAGVFLAAYFGIGAVKALRIAAILAWRLPPVRMKNAVKASAAFTGFVTFALAAGAALPALGDLGFALLIVAYAASFALNTAIGVVVFSLLPHQEEVPWTGLLPGALLVSAGMLGMHIFVEHYLAAKLARSPDLYGAFGSATVVLLWLFIAARLLVAGLFMNATLWYRRTDPETAAAPFFDDAGVRRTA